MPEPSSVPFFFLQHVASLFFFLFLFFLGHLFSVSFLFLPKARQTPFPSPAAHAWAVNVTLSALAPAEIPQRFSRSFPHPLSPKGICRSPLHRAPSWWPARGGGWATAPLLSSQPPHHVTGCVYHRAET